MAAVWLPELDITRQIPAAVVQGRDPLLVLAACCAPVEPVLRRLKCSSAEITRGRAVDRGPALPGSPEPVAVRRWMSAAGSAVDDLVLLAGDGPAAIELADMVRGVRQRGEATSRGELAVTGNDLVAAGVSVPGPELGRLLARLLDAVLDDFIAAREREGG
ncbi:MAG TPA: hypothetical protein PLL69_11925, partial [Gemmatimonadales bacterium]|nr:hypothetical protein [Gemmatimonadales bacterium]